MLIFSVVSLSPRPQESIFSLHPLHIPHISVGTSYICSFLFFISHAENVCSTTTALHIPDTVTWANCETKLKLAVPPRLELVDGRLRIGKTIRRWCKQSWNYVQRETGCALPHVCQRQRDRKRIMKVSWVLRRRRRRRRLWRRRPSYLLLGKGGNKQVLEPQLTGGAFVVTESKPQRRLLEIIIKFYKDFV